MHRGFRMPLPTPDDVDAIVLRRDDCGGEQGEEEGKGLARHAADYGTLKWTRATSCM